MIGVLLTSLLTYIESKTSDEFLDDMLVGLEEEIYGSYTKLGNYKQSDFYQILDFYCKAKNLKQEEVLLDFGKTGYYLISKMLRTDPSFNKTPEDGIYYLQDLIGGYIMHNKVLLKDAYIPNMKAIISDKGELVISYKSNHKLAYFYKGIVLEMAIDIEVDFQEVFLSKDGVEAEFILKSNKSKYG